MSLYMAICEGLEGQSTAHVQWWAYEEEDKSSQGDQSFIMPLICQNEASKATSIA